MLKKRNIAAAVILSFLISILFTGCGKKEIDNVSLEGSCHNILSQLYATADVDDTVREALENYVAMEIPDENQEYLLGTTEIEFTDSVASVPMVNVDPYQCVLLRVKDPDKVDEAKQLLSDNADPRKWVCVEAESVIIENVGDVILYIMAEQKTAEAVRNAFLALQQ